SERVSIPRHQPRGIPTGRKQKSGRELAACTSVQERPVQCEGSGRSVLARWKIATPPALQPLQPVQIDSGEWKGAGFPAAFPRQQWCAGESLITVETRT